MQRYNAELSCYAEELKSQRVMLTLTYEQAQAVGNIVYELHAELMKPQKDRYKEYPKDEMEPLHTQIYQTMCNVCLALEEKYRHEKNATPGKLYP